MNLNTLRSQDVYILADDVSENFACAVVAPVEKLTEPTVNRISKLTNGGIFTVAITESRANELGLYRLAKLRPNIRQPQNCDVLVSVEAKDGTKTGISIADRLKTIKVIGCEGKGFQDILSPGHIVPIAVKDGGTLVKLSLYEGAIDSCRLSELTPAALVVNLLNNRGDFVTKQEAMDIGTQNNLPLVYLSDIISHRLLEETLVERLASANCPTRQYGDFKIIIYGSKIYDGQHVALIKGDVDCNAPVLTRVQPESTLKDLFGHQQPSFSSKTVINKSLLMIQKEGSGVFIYVRRPESDAISASLEDYNNTSQSMFKQYGIGSIILRDLGIREIVHISTSGRLPVNTDKFGIRVCGIRYLS